jgi:hypothetical protein
MLTTNSVEYAECHSMDAVINAKTQGMIALQCGESVITHFICIVFYDGSVPRITLLAVCADGLGNLDRDYYYCLELFCLKTGNY